MNPLLERLRARYDRILLGLGALAGTIALLELFVNVAAIPALLWTARALDVVLLAAVTAEVVLSYVRQGALREFLRRRYGDVLVVGPALLLLLGGYPRAAGALVILRMAVVLSLRALKTGPLRAVLTRVALTPIRVLALSFAALIGVGALFLTAPAATVDGRGAEFSTALFTATSAVCVTGLTVVDTGTYFTRFGQVVILVLFQAGGLGIMTLTTAFRLLFKGKMGLRERDAMAEVLDATDDLEFRSLVRRIVIVTAIVEGIGAVLLFARVLEVPEAQAHSISNAVWLAVFHAVSAFCNAGFSLWPDSLVRFAGDMPVNVTVMSLVILGGLGFDVVAGLGRRNGRGLPGWWRGQTVHARIVLVASLALLAFGTVTFFFLEFDGALARLSLGDKLLAATFMSVTPRTAGFNTVDYATLAPTSLLVTMLLMYIGGSPGGTAGGVKTTTMVVLALAVRAMLTRRADVEVLGRSLPRTVVYRAVAVTLISFVLISVFFSLLLQLQAGRFDHLLFEAISAFATVGLSTGVTPSLNLTGRLVIIVLMFVGRIGPFTLALAVGERGAVARYQYPVGKVLVG